MPDRKTRGLDQVPRRPDKSGVASIPRVRYSCESASHHAAKNYIRRTVLATVPVGLLLDLSRELDTLMRKPEVVSQQHELTRRRFLRCGSGALGLHLGGLLRAGAVAKEQQTPLLPAKIKN